MMKNDEIGRELRSGELTLKQIVCLARPDSDFAVTAWVHTIAPTFIYFYQGVTRTVFAAHRREDGTIEDDTGVQVVIHEYLGEV